MKLKHLFVLLLMTAVFTSCSEDKNAPGFNYMGSYDMYYTKFYKAYTPNPVFRDSMTNQLPVEGTIARGHMPYPYGGATLAERAANQALAGIEVENPVAVDEEVITNGKAHYEIFCTDCHGTTGKGDGHLFSSGLFPAKPTSLVEEYVQGKPDGEIFYVITYGSISGLMGAHGSQIQPYDRWSIVNYLRELAK